MLSYSLYTGPSTTSAGIIDTQVAPQLILQDIGSLRFISKTTSDQAQAINYELTYSGKLNYTVLISASKSGKAAHDELLASVAMINAQLPEKVQNFTLKGHNYYYHSKKLVWKQC